MTTKTLHQDDPRGYELPCPACNAKPGEKCTAPTGDSRRPVSWQHYARTDQLALR